MADLPAGIRGPMVVNRHRFLPRKGFGPPPRKPLTGRERRPPLPDTAIYVGRGTPLGNPFRHEKYGSDALQLYRRWLFERLRRSDARVLRQMRSITEESLLVCSCAPKPCHADVVLAAWRWMGEVGLLDVELDRVTGVRR